MNLDLSSTFNFGDEDALRHFMLDHRFVHEQESIAFRAKFGSQQGTFGIGSQAAEDAWAAMMQPPQEHREVPQSLKDWLQLHASMHTQAYGLLGQNPSTAPDLSVVNFSVPSEFYDWLYAHQQMHDWEQSQLGLQ